MRKIKHSKYKNTGLIFEILVRQVARDTIKNEDSKALDIIKNYFGKNTELQKEYRLYDYLVSSSGVNESKANNIINVVLETSNRINDKKLDSQKYNLVKSIKESYNIDDFFTTKVKTYKPLAAAYCLLEANKSSNIVDPSVYVNNKSTLIEHLTNKGKTEKKSEEDIIKEFSTYSKDIRLMTYKILLNKFNREYENINENQKKILNKYISVGASKNELKEYVNSEYSNIKEQLQKLKGNVDNDIMKIKVNEVINNISTIPSNKEAKDDDIVNLMHYYDLKEELKNIKNGQ